ncbi:glycosyltransferase family 8 protein [Kordiimonas sp. SCSIO 12603]|uniref:glycosyltransferase family 8 protein n=1 Tax=Kordiimonas sp. SCSIO 12603 TaxID=2829596 RepID=UPI0021076B81|nr:glycosyltransferase family 8 protein [Kordiimonas sp. SCSIO 12603]UTW59024.1 glycosyltransferase family 8 protein [Kordiimonas sp. SCSIO 12603]
MQPNPDRGHFLFCTNGLYAQHSAACIKSLLENSSLKHHDICVVGHFEDTSIPAKLRSIADTYENADIRVIDFQPDDSLKAATKSYWSIDMFNRFWVVEFFESDVKRVLYLDSDIIVRGDIAPLFNTDLEGKMFGAVSIPHSAQCAALDLPPEYEYFNSGVLLFDMDKWRSSKPLDTLLPYIAANPDKLSFPDQDALNACYYADRHVLDYRWNLIVPFIWRKNELQIQASERKRIVREAVVVHYNTPLKPWHYLSAHPYKKDYWFYLRGTPWQHEKPQGKTALNMVKKLYNFLMPQEAITLMNKIRGR